jgi:hypothetical protein
MTDLKCEPAIEIFIVQGISIVIPVIPCLPVKIYPCDCLSCSLSTYLLKQMKLIFFQNNHKKKTSAEQKEFAMDAAVGFFYHTFVAHCTGVGGVKKILFTISIC